MNDAMKRNYTAKNIIEALLGYFAVSWLCFLFVYIGNVYGILSYNDLSGKLVVLIGQLSSMTISYMLLISWGEINSFAEFVLRIFSCGSWNLTRSKADNARGVVRTLLVIVFFGAAHGIIVVTSAKSVYLSSFYLFLIIPYCLLSYGLEEIAFRGIIYSALWENLPYFIAVLMTGAIHAIYYLPLRLIEGSWPLMHDFFQFGLYCVFLSIILCAIYRITGSVFSCIFIRVMIQCFTFYYDDLVFESGKLTVFYIIEMVVLVSLSIAIGYKPGKKDIE